MFSGVGLSSNGSDSRMSTFEARSARHAAGFRFWGRICSCGLGSLDRALLERSDLILKPNDSPSVRVEFYRLGKKAIRYFDVKGAIAPARCRQNSGLAQNHACHLCVYSIIQQDCIGCGWFYQGEEQLSADNRRKPPETASI